MKKAILLLSGGLDSATCALIARSHHFDTLYALSFSYAQRHTCELQAAQKIASNLGIREHRIINIDPHALSGSSALTTPGIDVPKDGLTSGIPVTYVPARNLLFLSYAVAWAEALGDCQDIFIGVNSVDYSGYPDCRSEFIESFVRTANLATAAGVGGREFRVHAPLVRLSKAEIIKIGADAGFDYGMTHSCYDPAPDGAACGRCDSCRIRKKGFEEAKIPDPTRYR